MSNYVEGPKGKGALFVRQKQSPQQPDYGGFVELTPDQLRLLVQMSQSGQEAKLQISLWKKRSQAGQPYLFAGTEVQVQQQRQQQQGGWGNQPQAPQQAPQQNWGPPPQQAPQHQGFRNPPVQQPSQQAPQQGGWGADDFQDDDCPF
jgi:hypothetical protein